MNKIFLTIAIFFSFIGYSQTVKDVSIQLQAQIVNSDIKVTWESTGGGSIYRKELSIDSDWVLLKSNIPSSQQEYLDNSVEVNKKYEYYLGRGNAYGYVSTGINIDALHNRGDLLLLIDSVAHSSLHNIIQDTLIMDLIGDGWNVETLIIGNNETSVTVKTKINSWYSGGVINPHLYILGHVPVPLSGNFGGTSSNLDNPPDGHVPQHTGAWATDAYYADINGTWTDNLTNTTATNAWGKNNPGDGKFDQHRIPDKTTEIAVGRVDLYSLPGISNDEMGLLRNYIIKSHLWKHKKTIVPQKALIADRLNYFNGEAPGRTGWMNLPGLIGSDNITENTNYFPHLKENTYLFSQVTSTAGYTSINGIGSMTNFKDSVFSVFNTYFGSYFGDFDNNNNFLRAAIAGKTHTLTSIWNGRPSWYYHNLGMGGTFGEATITSQSNSGDYFIYNNFINGIQMNLMGDPTLRIHPIEPVSSLISVKTNNDRQVSVSWTASSEPNVMGYYVYRSKTDQKDGEYELLTNSLITSTSFTDDAPYFGTNHYMVRSVKLEDKSSGTYMNLGQGIFTEIMGVESSNFYTDIEDPMHNNWTVYPNPTKDILFVNTQYSGNIKVKIVNTMGKLVYENLSASSNFSVKTNNFTPGIYFITIAKDSVLNTKKIIVQ